MPKTDWDQIKREREAALAAYDAMPEPTENTIEEITDALKREGFASISFSGLLLTVDEAVARNIMPLEDWKSLLQDWRYLNGQPGPTPAAADPAPDLGTPKAVTEATTPERG